MDSKPLTAGDANVDSKKLAAVALTKSLTRKKGRRGKSKTRYQAKGRWRSSPHSV